MAVQLVFCHHLSLYPTAYVPTHIYFSSYLKRDGTQTLALLFGATSLGVNKAHI